LRDILSEVKSTIRKGEKFPYVGMSDINPKQRTVVSNEVSTYGTGSRFKAGDILFARITPCLENGKIAQFKADEGQEAFGSTEFFVFRSNELVHQSYLYYLLRSYRIRKLAENSMVGASGRQRADLSFLTKQLVPLPPMELQEMFANIVDKR
jgi:type I restriction enzyme S subunit